MISSVLTFTEKKLKDRSIIVGLDCLANLITLVSFGQDLNSFTFKVTTYIAIFVPLIYIQVLQLKFCWHTDGLNNAELLTTIKIIEQL